MGRLGAYGHGHEADYADRKRADTRALRRRARLSRGIPTTDDEGRALADALADLRAAIRALPRGEEALVAVDADLADIRSDHEPNDESAHQAGDRLDAILEKVKSVTGREIDTASLVDPLRKIAALFGLALG